MLCYVCVITWFEKAEIRGVLAQQSLGCLVVVGEPHNGIGPCDGFRHPRQLPNVLEGEVDGMCSTAHPRDVLVLPLEPATESKGGEKHAMCKLILNLL